MRSYVTIVLLSLLALVSARYSPKSREEAAWQRIRVKRDPLVSFVIDEYVARADGQKYYGLKFEDAAQEEIYNQRDRSKEGLIKDDA